LVLKIIIIFGTDKTKDSGMFLNVGILDLAFPYVNSFYSCWQR